MNDSIKASKSESEITKFNELVNSDLIKNVISSTMVSFSRDELYELTILGNVKGGPFKFIKRKSLVVPNDILKSKQQATYNIVKVDRNHLILKNDRHLFYLERHVNIKLIENKNLDPFDFGGTWNNYQNAGQYGNRVVLDLKQVKRKIEGTLISYGSKAHKFGKNQFRPLEIKGHITGNIATIQIRELVMGQSSYRFIIYFLDCDAIDSATFKWQLKKIMYQDKNRQIVYMKGAINASFPLKSEFKRTSTK